MTFICCRVVLLVIVRLAAWAAPYHPIRDTWKLLDEGALGLDVKWSPREMNGRAINSDERER